MNPLLMGLLIVLALILLVIVFVLGQFLNLWIMARASGAPISMLTLVGMKLRQVDPRVIVYSRIRAMRAGLDLSTEQLETHHLAGGDVSRAVDALKLARESGVDLSWVDVSAMDLSNEDPQRLVLRMSFQDIVGQTGVTVEDLTPAGFVRIGDQRYPAMAAENDIHSGANVEVIDVVDLEDADINNDAQSTTDAPSVRLLVQERED